MIVVHHLNDSRSQRVLWLLEELGVTYDIKHYARDAQTRLAPPELKAVHPLGKSPVITDNGFTVYESGAIVDYLIRHQDEHGEWEDLAYTGTGFPRVFYLRYYGYSRYFPLWALATYARLRRGLPTRQYEVLAQGPIELGPFAAMNRG